MRKAKQIIPLIVKNILASLVLSLIPSEMFAQYSPWQLAHGRMDRFMVGEKVGHTYKYENTENRYSLVEGERSVEYALMSVDEWDFSRTEIVSVEFTHRDGNRYSELKSSTHQCMITGQWFVGAISDVKTAGICLLEGNTRENPISFEMYSTNDKTQFKFVSAAPLSSFFIPNMVFVDLARNYNIETIEHLQGDDSRESLVIHSHRQFYLVDLEDLTKDSMLIFNEKVILK